MEPSGVPPKIFVVSPLASPDGGRQYTFAIVLKRPSSM
jgi:hypothetical protein